MTHVLKQEVKVLMKSQGIYIGVLVLILCGWSGISSLLVEINSGFGIGEDMILLPIVLQEIFRSELFLMFLPIGCVLGATTSFLEEIQTRVIWYRLVRVSKSQYYCSKIIMAILSGSVIASLAGVGLIISCLFIFMPTVSEWILLKDYWSIELWLLIKSFMLVIIGGVFWSLLGAVSSIVAKSKYMAYAMPFILYYVWTTLVESYMPKVYILNLKEWLSLRRIDFGVSVTMFVALSILMSFIYYRLMERSVRNG